MIQIILGVVLIGVLVLSVVGFGFLSQEDESNEEEIEEKYTGFDFLKQGNLWSIELDEGKFYFQYLPEEVKNVSIYGFFDLMDYYQEPLYFVNENVGSSEIINNVGRYTSRYQGACLNNTNINCSENLPVKDCSNSNIIIFVDEKIGEVYNIQFNQTSVVGNESCVFISGEYARASDAFLYRMLKLI